MMRPHQCVQKLSVRLAVALAVWVLCASLVTATSAPCSGAVCDGMTNTFSVNGETYCCPSSSGTPEPSCSNFADPSTCTCPSTQNCGQLPNGPGRASQQLRCLFNLSS